MSAPRAWHGSERIPSFVASQEKICSESPIFVWSPSEVSETRIPLGPRATLTSHTVARTPSVPADQGLNGLLSVLDHVRTHGTSTRAQLVDATGLSRSVVTQRVA